MTELLFKEEATELEEIEEIRKRHAARVLDNELERKDVKQEEVHPTRPTTP